MFSFFGIFSSLFAFAYIAFIILAIIVVYRWMNRITELKEEQNKILKEIARNLNTKKNEE